MDRAKLHAQLVAHEGVRLKPYRCPSGKLTIGVGRNLDDVGITQEEARHLLNNDIAAAEKDLYLIFGPFWTSFGDARQRALIDMRFNLGPYRFRGFKKMLAAIGRGDWRDAAAEARDSRWFAQVGARGEQIVRMLAEGPTFAD